jgi:hypothetical protein
MSFSCLVQVLGLVNQTQSVFFVRVENSSYMKGYYYMQCVWIIEDRQKLTKLYKISIPDDNDTKGLESLA